MGSDGGAAAVLENTMAGVASGAVVACERATDVAAITAQVMRSGCLRNIDLTFFEVRKN